MKKIGNRPITEADTDFSKLQKKKEKKNQKFSENFSENFRDFFFLPFFSFTFFLKKMW